MVATRSARFSRCVLRCQGSRSPSTALMLRAACSIPPIQTPNPSKNGPSSSRYPTVNHFRPKPIGGEVAVVKEWGNEKFPIAFNTRGRAPETNETAPNRVYVFGVYFRDRSSLGLKGGPLYVDVYRV